ncbi:MAG: methyltransferase [Treponema sp.]|jgi:SAM-dependent methyltransferase|nr:methyltransferase [Treponema sp.]
MIDDGLFASHEPSGLRAEAAARTGSAPPCPALPLAVLDAGSGCGVLGICAAGALTDAEVRAEDRDELARLFTEYNARRNGLDSKLKARTEALLAFPPGASWDLILSNVPAKAGLPVLKDFIFRSALTLRPGGLALAVAVNPLADFFRNSIRDADHELFHEETESDHTVFAWKRKQGKAETAESAARIEAVYSRGSGDYELEGIGYHIDAVEGAAGFDRPGAAVSVAAKLVSKLAPPSFAPLFRRAGQGILIHEGDQGHFPVWFSKYAAEFLLNEGANGKAPRFVLSGRNILALQAARHNLENSLPGVKAELVPGVDIELSRETLACKAGKESAEGKQQYYSIAVLFPDLVPETDRIAAYWKALESLLGDGGIALIALPAVHADRFDRKKTAGFRRLGDLKREGFRALAFKRAL